MHDGNELCLESGLHVTSDVLNSGGDGVMGHERGVYDHTKAFHLQVGLVQGFKETAVIKIMIEWDGKVGVSDCSGKGGMFSGRWE